MSTIVKRKLKVSPTLPTHTIVEEPVVAPTTKPRKICNAVIYLVIFLHLALIPGTLYQYFNTADACKMLDKLHHEESSIPPLFHVQSPSVAAASKSISSWTSIYPGPVVEYTGQKTFEDHTHVVWTDASCAIILSDSNQRIQKIYSTLAESIQRLDFCRYVFIHRFGGVYHDADYILQLPILNYVPEGVGVVESPYRYNEDVQNSLMTSSPGHKFWIWVAEEVGQRKGTKGVLGRTGPKMLSDAYMKFKTIDSGTVSKLDCLLFQRIPHTIDSTFLNILAREYITRWVPMKGCGTFAGECEIARHLGKASWTKGSGIW